VSDREFEAINEASMFHNVEKLQAILDAENAGWKRPTITKQIEKWPAVDRGLPGVRRRAAGGRGAAKPAKKALEVGLQRVMAETVCLRKLLEAKDCAVRAGRPWPRLVSSTEASFDVTTTQALTWLNRSWRTMLGRARAYRKTVSFGNTVANDATYDAPAGIVELYSLEVAAVPYGRARREDVYWNTQGRLAWTYQGETGLFYPDATTGAVSSITLVPTPTTAGLAMTGLAATYPPDLTNDGRATRCSSPTPTAGTRG
jgi:hypothetical protein